MPSRRSHSSHSFAGPDFGQPKKRPQYGGRAAASEAATEAADAASRAERQRGNVVGVYGDQVDIGLGSEHGVDPGERGVIRLDDHDVGFVVEEVSENTSTVRLYDREQPADLDLMHAPVVMGAVAPKGAFQGEARIMRQSVIGEEVRLTISGGASLGQKVGQVGQARDGAGRPVCDVIIVRVEARAALAVPVDAMDAGLTKLQSVSAVHFDGATR